ncbi:DUF4054 domain-containing protein [Candidatus Pacearchaeota archaeon]|nr:DUF4054 domain-containing protein [Candidatus Pacearchaeota archaeon]
MITPSTFKVRFPEFDSVDDARIQLFLDDAELILNSAYWGDKLDLGTSYYTAHALASAPGAEGGSSAGTTGPVSARAVDGASVTYGSSAPVAGSQGEAYYLSTSYGQKYLALVKSLGVAAQIA